MSDTDNKQTKKSSDAEAKKSADAKRVLHTVSQTNGFPLHLCADGEWRTDEQLAKLGESE